ncbi:unnamed protein product [Coregonus sp. 'balchen']|nr:unnamed protein product [Coregonus sp. 'balchen']
MKHRPDDSGEFEGIEVIWEGLWMSCLLMGQCKFYDSLLPQDLQASRAMTIIAIVLGVLGVMVFIIGAKCIKCIKEEPSKAKLIIITGIFFILAGILIIIISIHHLNENWQLMASLYFSWGAVSLLLIGGATLSSLCPPSEIGIILWGHMGPDDDHLHLNRPGSSGIDGGHLWSKCTNCIKSNWSRAKVMFIIGIFFILAGILQLTTSCLPIT